MEHILLCTRTSLFIHFLFSCFSFNNKKTFKTTTTHSSYLSSSNLNHSPKMTSTVIQPTDDKAEEKPVDREKTCPLLLRVFLSNGRHHAPNEYSRGNVPPNELQIYTWNDATLKELTGLVKEVNPEARRKGTFFDFALLFPDSRTPGYRMRDIGSTCSGQKGVDDGKTLSQCRFQIGDYLDIAITPPQSRPLPRQRQRF